MKLTKNTVQMIDYQEFIEQKRFSAIASGVDVLDLALNPNLFPFQRDLVKLALKMGKFCLWANTGLGKTLSQLSWSDALVQCGAVERVLILAPLGVAKQTVKEGEKFGIQVKYCSDDNDVIDGINITNYDRLHKFDTSIFDAVVLDESSILKDESSSTCQAIIDAFKYTPYKLACSATPSPNDYMELGNQCEFLGVMTRQEMLSMFFVHDGGETAKWRLKGHSQSKFWEFVCTWAVMLQKPSDLGYDDDGYTLPPIKYHTHYCSTVIPPAEGKLIFDDSASMAGQRLVRKISMRDRCELAAKLVKDNPNELWLIWCETNDESAYLNSLIPDAVEVKGSNSNEFKEQAMLDFALGAIPVLITKPKIAGLGMNFQRCHNVIYIGLTHSFEMFYQSVRRVWRYGQKNEVAVHIIQHHAEGQIASNLRRKEQDAAIMGQQMVKHMQAISLEQLKGVARMNVEYNPSKDMKIPKWLVSEV